MISKIAESAAAAVRDIPDGATLMVGGFGTAGQPVELIDALLDQGARDLVIVNNNAGNGKTGLAALLGAGRVRKIICSFPRQADSQSSTGCTGRGSWNSSWCLRARSPSASGPAELALPASSPRRHSERPWRKARRGAERRLRADQSAPRRSAWKLDLPQDSQELRPADGKRRNNGDRPGEQDRRGRRAGSGSRGNSRNLRGADRRGRRQVAAGNGGPMKEAQQ